MKSFGKLRKTRVRLAESNVQLHVKHDSPQFLDWLLNISECLLSFLYEGVPRGRSHREIQAKHRMLKTSMLTSGRISWHQNILG